MGGYNIARSIAIVVAALLLIGFIDQTLERTLVAALAPGVPTDAAGYLAVRNRPGVLAVTVVTHGLASLLTGYVLGRLAGTLEVQHAIATAVIATVAYALASVTPSVMLPPLWARACVLAITPPALIAGAYIRAQARAVREAQETRM